MIRFSPLLLLCALGCSAARPPARSAPHPDEVEATGALKAVHCGDVTAIWRGRSPDEGVPLGLFVDSLSFHFADGTERPFKPVNHVEPFHTSFEIFSPDCAWVALAQDSYGPYHLVPVSGLADYLSGRRAPLSFKPPTADTAPILTEQRWVTPTRLEFFASCCGGVEVFQIDVDAPERLERVFFAPVAPSGIRRAGSSFEVVR